MFYKALFATIATRRAVIVTVQIIGLVGLTKNKGGMAVTVLFNAMPVDITITSSV